ncbi:MAG TPA: translation elongation factor-like protein [Candidatus Thermoplasmatota archaeon]|nr:translation elongation factor-like protein [Candidatus Thermoplasmatota archaeon]
MAEEPIGRVTHFWPKAGAASLELSQPLKLGDRVRIRGHGHDFVQSVTSLQVQREPRRIVTPGQEVAIRVTMPVHEDDEVLRIVEEEPLARTAGVRDDRTIR